MLTRRALLGRTAISAGSLAFGSSALARVARAATAAQPAWPSPAEVRADVQTMVDFGPRLTGFDAHNDYIAWLEREFTDAGCRLLPCDVYETSRWEAHRFGLDIVDGATPGKVRVGAYFPRSKETPEAGVKGPLVYAGSPPPLSTNGTDPGALQAGLARYPADLASWAQALPGTLSGSPQGSILLVDLPAPAPTTAGVLAGDMTFYNGQGESEADVAQSDYERLWLFPGLANPLQPFEGLGAAGVVFIVDASYEALAGQYLPFEWQNENIPALYVDRDTGAKLRAQAAARPTARLTLTATRKTVPTPAVTAILPGASKETLIFNTHTDGQGFVEENGAVGFVHLARYFATRPLKRTLVFAAWPGHMSNDLPQAQGWIDAHPDLVENAAAALTVEHLGCTEWSDTTDKGYRPTGRAELFAIWTSQGKMFDATRDAVVKLDLPRTALMRPPAQFGVGGPFYQAGIPEIGAIAGPEYLLTVSDNGDMDKFDERLAAKQIAFLAELATQLDAIPAADLKAGDPLLGSPAPKGNLEPSDAKPKPVDCTPPPQRLPQTIRVARSAGRSLRLRWYGRRRSTGGILLVLDATGGRMSGVSVELRRHGKLVARRTALKIGSEHQRVVLRRRGRHRFAGGAYTIVVRHAGKVIARREVTTG